MHTCLKIKIKINKTKIVQSLQVDISYKTEIAVQILCEISLASGVQKARCFCKEARNKVRTGLPPVESWQAAYYEEYIFGFVPRILRCERNSTREKENSKFYMLNLC